MSHMALYHQIESSSAVAVLQGIYQLLLVYNPPRFYILLLLVSVLLVILCKAGFFDGSAGRSVDGCEKDVGGDGPIGQGVVDLCDGACAVAVSCESDAEEEYEIVKEELCMEQEPDKSDTEASPCTMISEERSMIIYEDIGMEGDESAVEELHRRVEAYITKVRSRFSTESIA